MKVNGRKISILKIKSNALFLFIFVFVGVMQGCNSNDFAQENLQAICCNDDSDYPHAVGCFHSVRHYGRIDDGERCPYLF